MNMPAGTCPASIPTWNAAAIQENWVAAQWNSERNVGPSTAPPPEPD